jgi:acyl-coenzyme A thioesterase PaaI-like protein
MATATATIGPHASLVARLYEQAEELDELTIARLFHAWSARSASTADPFMDHRCIRRAREEARRADRLELFETARSEAALRFRDAHRGDPVGTGLLGLSMAVADAAAALVVADLLDAKTFDWLYAPWRIAVEEAESLRPVGPGRVPFGTITERRRLGVPGPRG